MDKKIFPFQMNEPQQIAFCKFLEHNPEVHKLIITVLTDIIDWFNHYQACEETNAYTKK